MPSHLENKLIQEFKNDDDSIGAHSNKKSENPLNSAIGA